MNPRRERPADFEKMAHLTQIELCKRYRTGPKVIRRWRGEVGYKPLHGHGNRIPVEQRTIDGELVGIYPSAYEAAKHIIGAAPTNILKAARSEMRTAYGYRWTIKSEDGE